MNGDSAAQLPSLGAGRLKVDVASTAGHAGRRVPAPQAASLRGTSLSAFSPAPRGRTRNGCEEGEDGAPPVRWEGEASPTNVGASCLLRKNERRHKEGDELTCEAEEGGPLPLLLLEHARRHHLFLLLLGRRVGVWARAGVVSRTQRLEGISAGRRTPESTGAEPLRSFLGPPRSFFGFAIRTPVDEWRCVWSWSPVRTGGWQGARTLPPAADGVWLTKKSGSQHPEETKW